MKDFIIIDTHCDTAELICDTKHNLRKNSLHLDINRMKGYKSYGQFFALYLSEEHRKNPVIRTLDIINSLYSEITSNSNDVMLCKNSEDYYKALTKNKIPAFISVEGAYAVKSIEILDALYLSGVRMMSLTHNQDSHLAGGCVGKNQGLTKVGKEIIRRMNELGMIIDVSHSSEKTFYDICSLTSAPIIASHSNSASLCPHPRNITDAQFLEIKKLKGAVGINYYPPFLTNNPTATIDDIANHIIHFLSLGGEDNICLGSDFDGISSLPDGISGAEDVYKIIEKLSTLGISDNIIEKIAYKNILRIIGICL